MIPARIEPAPPVTAGGRFPWAAEGVVARLTALWTEEGKSASEIAQDLSARTGHTIDRNAVLGKLHRLKLTGHGARSYKETEEGAVVAPSAPSAAIPPPAALSSVPEPLNSAATAALAPSAAPPDEAVPIEAAEPDAAPVKRLPFQPSESRPRKAAHRPAKLALPGIDFFDARPGHCRWIISPDRTPTRFCGEEIENVSNPDSPWCAEHAAVVFDRRTPIELRRDRERASQARAARGA